MKTTRRNYSVRLGLAAAAILAVSDCAMAERLLTDRRTLLTPAPEPFPAPKNLTVQETKDGVMLNWSQVPTQPVAYLVLRGTDSAPADPAVAVLSTYPTPLGSFLDRGFHKKASYQVVALAPDGRRGASAIISFQPVMPAPSEPLTLSATTLGRPSAFLTATPATSGPPTPTPTIYMLRQESAPWKSPVFARAGDTFVVYGAGLDGLTSVTLNYATQNVSGVWGPITNSYASFPLALKSAGPTVFKFSVPENVAERTISRSPHVVVIATKGATSVASADNFIVGPTPVERKILSVEYTNVLAGGLAYHSGRVKIHGQGFLDVSGPGGYLGVIGGYFGAGTLGSVNNPLISVANLGDNYCELWLPPNFEQKGELMLTAPKLGGDAELILPHQPIVVTSFKSIPKGYIVDAVPNPTGFFPNLSELVAQPGSQIRIHGESLSGVSRVLDGDGHSYPFSCYPAGYSGVEEIAVTLPDTRGWVYQFMLESKLDPPTLPTWVDNYVSVPK